MAYTKHLEWLVRSPIAHRGLHDGNRVVAENSLVAADGAIKSGYAIECDVQLSANGTPHVFHDDTLKRLAGDARRFRDVDDEALATMELAGTGACIPTVERFLSHIAGRVPIVMELKGISSAEDAGFMAKLAPVLARYAGDLALMSFDAGLLDQIRHAGVARPIGLTAEGRSDDALAAHRRIVERGCDFVSYNVHHLPNAFCDWLRNERQIPVICWTVRTPDDAATARDHADQITFEGFAPQH